MNPLDPIKFVFPSYSAAVMQAKTHGVEGGQFVVKAVKTPELTGRLDNAVRALNGFDHAITSADRLPIAKLVPQYTKYRLGYEATKKAVGLLVGSGVIPGAKERVGKQELLAVGDELTRSVASYRSNNSRYGRYVAMDDLGAAWEDARTGVSFLEKQNLARPILEGLSGIGNAMSKSQPVTDDQVSAIQKLLAQATGQLDAVIAKSKAAPVSGAEDMLTEALAELQKAQA